MEKTLNNSDTNGAEKQVKDIEKFGNPDMFKLLCKASSKDEGWMKSTKAMEIPHVGCMVQVSTQQGNNVAEAVVFIPGVRIVEEVDASTKEIIGRRLMSSIAAAETTVIIDGTSI